MGIRTKSIYEPKEKEDGLRVLITRYYPRGVKKDRFDRWMKELSPSIPLLRAYKDGKKTWDELASGFEAEVNANPAALEAIDVLKKESRKGSVTLLCYEKAPNPCHRTIVAELIKNRNPIR